MADDFWEAHFGITPQPVSDADVWRAAHQMLKMFSGEAWLTAAQRADKALEIGDMFNFELWTRITSAVEELERTKPKDGEPVN